MGTCGGAHFGGGRDASGSRPSVLLSIAAVTPGATEVTPGAAEQSGGKNQWLHGLPLRGGARPEATSGPPPGAEADPSRGPQDSKARRFLIGTELLCQDKVFGLYFVVHGDKEDGCDQGCCCLQKLRGSV